VHAPPMLCGKLTEVKEACIAAELSALKHERAVAVALAEAEVLEAAAETECREGSRSHHDTAHVAIQRTRDYVEHHSQLHLSDAEPPVLQPYTASLSSTINPNAQSDIKDHVLGQSISLLAEERCSCRAAA